MLCGVWSRTTGRTTSCGEEGHAPQVVFEISSKTTRDDLGVKMRLYAQLGVEEYYLYDPTGDYLEPPLAAFRLVGGGFVPMQPVEEAPVGHVAFLLGEGEPPEFIASR